MERKGLYVKKLRIICRLIWHKFNDICNFKRRLGSKYSSWNIFIANNLNPRKRPIPLLNMSSCSRSMQRTWWPVVNIAIEAELKRKCLHFDGIFITGCTESCQNDNFRCSQWWRFHQNDHIFVSVWRLLLQFPWATKNLWWQLDFKLPNFLRFSLTF